MKILTFGFLLTVATTISCAQEKKSNQEAQSSIYNSEDLIAVLDTIWRDEQESCVSLYRLPSLDDLDSM
jgi:hypothetical protein